MKTSLFVGTIGSDVALPILNAYVQLKSGSLANCLATFSSGLVDRYDNLTISLTSLSVMNPTSIIEVTFPSTYKRLYTSGSIGITTSMVCLTNLQTYGINCQGNTPSSNIVTINYSFPVNGSTSTSFQINSILVPPTIEQADIITISTFTSAGVSYDSCQVTYSNLNAAVMNSLSLSTGTGTTPSINSRISANFSIPLLTNFYNSDYMTLVLTSSYTPLYQLTSLSGNVLTLPSNYTPIFFTINSNTSSSLNLSINLNVTQGNIIYLNISSIITPPSTGTSITLTISLYQA